MQGVHMLLLDDDMQIQSGSRVSISYVIKLDVHGSKIFHASPKSCDFISKKLFYVLYQSHHAITTYLGS